MKKIFPFLLLWCIVILIFINVKVTTRQGINYQWQTIEVPLYLKILDFFDRHYNYKHLVKGILADTRREQGRAIKIFEWTYNNLKKTPEGFPIMDDHVWYIIVRGYGVDDQFSDVFTTLCNYAGLGAYYSWIYTSDRAKRIPLCFVKIEKKWCVFDPYNGNYFKNSTGDLADVEELRSRAGWKLYSLNETIDPQEEARQYTPFFTNLPIIEHLELNRANVQSPFNRLLFQIKSLSKKYFTKKYFH